MHTEIEALKLKLEKQTTVADTYLAALEAEEARHADALQELTRLRKARRSRETLTSWRRWLLSAVERIVGVWGSP